LVSHPVTQHLCALLSLSTAPSPTDLYTLSLHDALPIFPFPKDTDAFAALLAGRVDAYFADAPPAAYYAKLNSTKVQVCCHPINPIPIGIAIRKHDPLRAAVQKGVKTLYTTGAMKKILAKWGMTNAAVLLKK